MNKDLVKARAYYYEFFAMPFFFYESDEYFKKWQEQLAFLSQNPLNDDSLNAFSKLKNFDFSTFRAEQNSVLFDLSYVNVPLNVSFYNEGRDDGQARLMVIEILKQSPYRRDFERCKDSEDFVGFVFLLMATFLKDELNDDKVLSVKLFSDVINGFIDEFLSMLKHHKKADFFKNFAVVFENFIALERLILAINAPKKDPNKQSVAEISLAKEPYQTKMPTAKSKINWDEFTAL